MRTAGDRSDIELFTGTGESHTVQIDEERDQFKLQMDAFLDTIRDGTASRTLGVRERDTFAIIETGYESIAGGTSVDVDLRGV